MSNKSRILAVPENTTCTQLKAFFVKQIRLSIPSLPQCGYIKGSLAITGCGSLLNLKLFIMPENQKEPITPHHVIEDYLAEAQNEGVCPLSALRQLYYLTMTSGHFIDKNARIWLSIGFMLIDRLLEKIEFYNEN